MNSCDKSDLKITLMIFYTNVYSIRVQIYNNLYRYIHMHYTHALEHKYIHIIFCLYGNIW